MLLVTTPVQFSQGSPRYGVVAAHRVLINPLFLGKWPIRNCVGVPVRVDELVKRGAAEVWQLFDSLLRLLKCAENLEAKRRG